MRCALLVLLCCLGSLYCCVALLLCCCVAVLLCCCVAVLLCCCVAVLLCVLVSVPCCPAACSCCAAFVLSTVALFLPRGPAPQKILPSSLGYQLAVRARNLQKMSEAAVQVAVRMRPFNGREQKMNAKRCIDMEGANTLIYEEDGAYVAPADRKACGFFPPLSLFV